LVDEGAQAAALNTVEAVNAAFKFWEVRPWFLARTSAKNEFAKRAAASWPTWSAEARWKLSVYGGARRA
jgi:hypothetical protein